MKLSLVNTQMTPHLHWTVQNSPLMNLKCYEIFLKVCLASDSTVAKRKPYGLAQEQTVL